MAPARKPRIFGKQREIYWKGMALAMKISKMLAQLSPHFALLNRMVHLTDIRPNDEFYTMGRGQSGRLGLPLVLCHPFESRNPSL